jgi:hypothetical protein
MEVTREAVRANIIERANWGAMKAGAPELYHTIVMLLAYIDNDFSEIEHKEGTWFQAKPKGDQPKSSS